MRHWYELRSRLLQISVFFIVFFVLSFACSASLLQWMVWPLTQALPGGDRLIMTGVTSTVMLPVHLALDVAGLVTLPYALFHAWRFIAPGLLLHERIGFKRVLFNSGLMFCAGLAFCFYVVLPLMFALFVVAKPSGVHYMPEMSSVLDFMLTMMAVFGLCFQLPLVCWLGVSLKLLTLRQLIHVRPYAIVTAFVLGMLLTPPDVSSQLLLAIPLCALYEIGILSCRWFIRHDGS